MEEHVNIPEEGNDVLLYPLSMIRKIGLYSETNGKKVAFVAGIYITLFTFWESIILMQYPGTANDVLEFVSNTEALGSVTQGIGKIGLLVYQRKELVTLIKATKSFWNTCVLSHSLKVKLDKVSSNILHLEKIFFRLVYATVFAMYSLLLFGRPLILGVWNTANYKILYKIVLLVQVFGMPIYVVCVIAVDCMFVAFCAKLVEQYRILRYKFEELRMTSEENYFSELKLCIQQHDFLLRFTRHLQEYYSLIALVEYITIAPLLCTDMFAIYEGGTIQVLLRQGLAMISETIQLAFYCIPADFLTKEVSAISDAAFNSQWYENRKFSTLRSPLTLVIQRSQNQKIFKAGGLIEIRSAALVSVLKVSWSICTIIIALK